MAKGFKTFFTFYICTLSCLPAILSFGYDSASSCSPKMARKGRAQLLTSIPCDLKQQAYCNLPGSSYPWHAVRRFVHENQGLMKRMYGDVRHISILRTEIQNNEINVEDIEDTQARYSRDGLRKTKYLHTEYQNSKANDILTEPHFRPTSTSTTTTTTITTPKTTGTTTTAAATTMSGSAATATTKSISTSSVIEINSNSETENIKNTLDNNLESNNIIETSSPSSIMENIKVVPAPNLSINRTESATISTTLKVVQQIIKSEIESEKAERQEIPQADIIPILDKRNNEKINTDQVEDDNEMDIVTVQHSTATEKFEQITSSSNENVSGNNKGTEFFSEKKKTTKPNTLEGQLFQDTIQKETPIVNLRGVNACPVKEEVVAPFWANNTRGEVLALLNLYPFEQYVHWEKCTHEHKQMYCRDGCRCEQQYRLHRLLAYDPHNECRGIFSDWFRFPSCCICKCYDIPLDFRATSRSPRTSADDEQHQQHDQHDQQHQQQEQQQKGKYNLDKAEEEVRKAIYEHATKDWYRPRDEFDFFYD